MNKTEMVRGLREQLSFFEDQERQARDAANGIRAALVAMGRPPKGTTKEKQPLGHPATTRDEVDTTYGKLGQRGAPTEKQWLETVANNGGRASTTEISAITGRNSGTMYGAYMRLKVNGYASRNGETHADGTPIHVITDAGREYLAMLGDDGKPGAAISPPEEGATPRLSMPELRTRATEILQSAGGVMRGRQFREALGLSKTTYYETLNALILAGVVMRSDKEGDEKGGQAKFVSLRGEVVKPAATPKKSKRRMDPRSGDEVRALILEMVEREGEVEMHVVRQELNIMAGSSMSGHVKRLEEEGLIKVKRWNDDGFPSKPHALLRPAHVRGEHGVRVRPGESVTGA